MKKKKGIFLIFMYELSGMRRTHIRCIKMNSRYIINVNGNIIRLKIINLAQNYSIKQRGFINQSDLRRFFSLIHFRTYTRVSDSKYTPAFEINLLIHLF